MDRSVVYCERSIGKVEKTDMEWLSYNHLHAFWVVARAGGVSKAAAELHVTHSTISAQIRALAEFCGTPLFTRRGRGLQLTPFGTEVLAFADDIFLTGSELVEFVRGRGTGRRALLNIGVVSAVPRTVAFRLLEPALRAPAVVRVSYRQATLNALVAELSLNRLHLVLSDALPPQGQARVYGHLLGKTEIIVYGTRSLARRVRHRFPESLDGAPFLVPGPESGLRRLLERFFVEKGIRPHVVGEFDDAAAMRTFGLHGFGLFPVRAALAAEVGDLGLVERAGVLRGVEESFYAITTERKIKHPGVGAIVETARQRLV